MIRKALIICGAAIGAVVGFLRTENVVQDLSGIVWGIMMGAFVAYFVCGIVRGLLDE